MIYREKTHFSLADLEHSGRSAKAPTGAASSISHPTASLMSQSGASGRITSMRSPKACRSDTSLMRNAKDRALIIPR
jgi:hypothetical protein